MAIYVFQCPEGHVVEIKAPMGDSDIGRICPEHHAKMKRQYAPPLAVQWEGKFANRSFKVRDGEW